MLSVRLAGFQRMFIDNACEGGVLGGGAVESVSEHSSLLARFTHNTLGCLRNR